jgi:hypothetical protein
MAASLFLSLREGLEAVLLQLDESQVTITGEIAEKYLYKTIQRM